MENASSIFWSGGKKTKWLILLFIGICGFYVFGVLLQPNKNAFHPIKSSSQSRHVEANLLSRELFKLQEAGRKGTTDQQWLTGNTKERKTTTKEERIAIGRDLQHISNDENYGETRGAVAGDSSNINDTFLTSTQRLAMQVTRQEVLDQVTEYLRSINKTTSDVVPELGGTPTRCMVATTWRSGSTFIAEALTAHPGVFYHYEPLLDFLINQIRKGPSAKRAIQVLQKLMHCDYGGLDSYISYGVDHSFLWSHTTPLYRWKDLLLDEFYDPRFLSSFCSLFPVQIIKTVRLRGHLLQALLEDSSLNLRVILLVRDPRGTLQSRKHRQWCPGNPDCENPRILCEDLYDDYKAAQLLTQRYPERFMALRYEDASLTVNETIPELLNFCGLEHSESVQEFLKSHTTFSSGGVSSTYRDSKKTPFMWRERLKWSEVDVIQKRCGEAMKAWKYRKATKKNLLTFNPVVSLS